MKKMIFLLCVISSLFTNSLYANWLEDIFKSQLRIEALQSGILDKDAQMLGIQRNILKSQKDIDSLMKQVNGHLTSHSGWGTYQFHDYQSYGGSARDWSNVLRMAENGQGGGNLGHVIGGISKQFSADTNTYNKSIKDVRSQKYYALKAQTILAARAASQLDYNKIQEQISYQRMLQQQIEKTQDLKAAVDLQNRIQVEGNLINLEVLRQTALANQQQAVTEQASINAALSNARFLNKK